jgi:hypothetical protein
LGGPQAAGQRQSTPPTSGVNEIEAHQLHRWLVPFVVNHRGKENGLAALEMLRAQVR